MIIKATKIIKKHWKQYKARMFLSFKSTINRLIKHQYPWIFCIYHDITLHLFDNYHIFLVKGKSLI